MGYCFLNGLVENMQMTRFTARLKPNKSKYFFKEWRKFRGYTQEELADIVGLAAPGISQLENGKQGFTDSSLEALAEALACTPADLLSRNPLDENSPENIWPLIKVEDRSRVADILRAFVDNKKAA